ncbi:hypothetical protein P280DRAFT_479049 [Massarina eburnea CBS 473.64]|uniref:Uncharacterized protein n=1 Tax=Massarina eburnea CBS 473.64 TaxID=1395130 RepID=A0A6A6S5S6_9PLEO|nr:hypothetical protein P280DRAFT_479049 [Massarina eburnea CBS 473.64]
MSSLGDLRNRLSATIAEANAAGWKIIDVVPEEVQAHFQDLSELKQAREYIKEADAREADLQQKLSNTEQKLMAAEQAVKDLPDDHVQRLQDLTIATNSVLFYKSLHEAAENRANNFKKKWRELDQKQANINTVKSRADALQEECEHQKIIISNLITENRSKQNMIETAKDTHERAMEAKNQQLQALKAAQEAEAQFQKERARKYEDLDRERDEFEATVNGLVEDLEDDKVGAVTALNTVSARKRNLEQLHMTILSEVKYLRRALAQCAEVIAQCQPVVQDLVMVAPAYSVQLPETYPNGLREAAYELESFECLRNAMEDQPLDKVRAELGILGASLYNMRNTLVAITDAFTVPNEVSQQTIWDAFRFKLNGAST